MVQSQGINVSFMELTSVSWNMVSFMEYRQFHGIWNIIRYLHGRLTGISTRRALYGRLYTDISTIRLKAKNVSASKYDLILGPEMCTLFRFILRSF